MRPSLKKQTFLAIYKDSVRKGRLLTPPLANAASLWNIQATLRIVNGLHNNMTSNKWMPVLLMV